MKVEEAVVTLVHHDCTVAHEIARQPASIAPLCSYTVT